MIGPAAPDSAKFGSGNVTGIAALIFTTYVFPFEITSALLITAALGAMVLAHRERTSPKPTQKSLSRQRIASGQPDPAARPRHLRPAQRGGHARAAARRHDVRPVGQRGHHRAAPSPADAPERGRRTRPTRRIRTRIR